MKFSEVELPSNRKFGFFFAAVFAAICAYFYVQGGMGYVAIFSILAIGFALVSFMQADLLLPLNKLWMRFGLLLGAIVSPIVLGLMFFLLFTPIAISMRLFGRDELMIKKNKRASYWKRREPSGPSAESFKYQF